MPSSKGHRKHNISSGAWSSAGGAAAPLSERCGDLPVARDDLDRPMNSKSPLGGGWYSPEVNHRNVWATSECESSTMFTE